MRLIFIISFSMLILSGCATSRRQMLERSNAIQVDFIGDSKNDYMVAMYETTLLGWDGRDRETRLKTIKEMFESSCKTITVADEKQIEGTNPETGKPHPAWAYRVHCEK